MISTQGISLSTRLFCHCCFFSLAQFCQCKLIISAIIKFDLLRDLLSLIWLVLLCIRLTVIPATSNQFESFLILVINFKQEDFISCLLVQTNKKSSGNPDSNQGPPDNCVTSTVGRSTNWAIAGSSKAYCLYSFKNHPSHGFPLRHFESQPAIPR